MILEKATNRLNVVDALRGASLLAILLLHNILHFNLYYIPENQPQWIIILDKCVFKFFYLFISGKAYIVFSLLFGFSFYIQLRNQERKGNSFKWRFAWRMLLLLFIAEFHALFYSGNILSMYAFVGLILIPFGKSSNQTILKIATICLLQPLELLKIIATTINQNMDISYLYLNFTVNDIMMNGSFIDAIKANFTDGQICNTLYYIEKGRLFQTAGLFLLGLLLGKEGMFEMNNRTIFFWKKTRKLSSITFVVFLVLNKTVGSLGMHTVITESLDTIFLTLTNLSMAFFLISIFVLLWFRKTNMGHFLQQIMIPYGRMSLTNYIFQSIIGVTIYYGFGFGMYKYLGATLSMLVGLVIFLIQLAITRIWLKHNKQGILEYLWKKGTWIYSNRK